MGPAMPSKEMLEAAAKLEEAEAALRYLQMIREEFAMDFASMTKDSVYLK